MNVHIIQAMINAIEKPAVFIDEQYTIRAANDAYTARQPLPVDINESKCHKVSHHSDVPCDQNGESCPLAQCRETQRPANVIHVHETPNGKRYCDIVMKPIYDDEAKLLGYIEIITDVPYASVASKANTLLGQSAAFKNLVHKINRAATADIAVLLQGETGTGKELVAHALHTSSQRSQAPFVIIECAGLNDNLFESELFGHEKGAFTGANFKKRGLVESAQGGTIFFDEIGDVPLNMQVKLLRLLETKRYRSVGGLMEKQADFRLVCATHKDLAQMVKHGEFRQDLYYRIAGFPIHLPSLRERKSDIPMLIEHFLQSSTLSQGSDSKVFHPDALALLLKYPFPGNIRELRSIVEQSTLLALEDEITPDDLPEHIRQYEPSPDINEQSTRAQSVDLPMTSSNGFALTSLADAEADYLRQCIAHFEGHIDELAQQLGISRRTLYRKLQQHNLSPH